MKSKALPSMASAMLLVAGLGTSLPTMAQQSAAPDTRPFAFARGKVDPPPPATCAFPGLVLPKSAKVLAAGAYGGVRQDFQIDGSGHMATRIDVAVNQRSAPVVLMLGAYEPTVWNLGWTPGTHVLAVLVSGYHRQVVTGLPARVPVLVSSHDNHGPCGYFYVTPERAGHLNPIARNAFGRPVEMLYPARDGQVVVGDVLPSSVELVTDRKAAAPESFRLPDTQLAGPAGLEQAVREGLLREATQADVDAWFAAQRALPRGDEPPIAGGAPRPRLSMIRGYVVLKAYTLPPGLYGANSATFFVPKGVPRPRGELGHSTLYDFNTLGCSGVPCRVE